VGRTRWRGWPRPGSRMAEYVTHLSQARRLRELALEEQTARAARHRATCAAYLWLAQQPQGQLLLDDWCLVLLQPAQTPEDTGERRFIQRILKVIAEDAPRALEEEQA
jgi:hypothetical protein